MLAPLLAYIVAILLTVGPLDLRVSEEPPGFPFVDLAQQADWASVWCDESTSPPTPHIWIKPGASERTIAIDMGHVVNCVYGWTLLPPEAEAEAALLANDIQHRWAFWAVAHPEEATQIVMATGAWRP